MFPGRPFAAACGMELVESRPGYALVRMPLEKRHMNLMGVGPRRGHLRPGRYGLRRRLPLRRAAMHRRPHEHAVRQGGPRSAPCRPRPRKSPAAGRSPTTRSASPTARETWSPSFRARPTSAAARSRRRKRRKGGGRRAEGGRRNRKRAAAIPCPPPPSALPLPFSTYLRRRRAWGPRSSLPWASRPPGRRWSTATWPRWPRFARRSGSPSWGRSRRP